ncbi:antibiotic transport system ATP-binding protein [Thermotomaculum hydrothermale]|uniref:Antibiotic transport system ATP-binding protein n=1 Tax=Thermotomaculum hydrothermale TaxID=981385 RepID=A0A7R6PMF2_9BACT|nr:ATP-binding cassette domain-containing protein [Thermotomaculum hydrothermale]BBB31806.1 antibiotic transport system ATP-binding protein [Thermotomaculum hydrothermale]
MIKVEGLTKYYGDFLAVDNISFEVKKGEIVGLLGPNGAGKTTTLRILTGYLLPSGGSVKIKDYDIYKDLREIKKTIGYLPETTPLYGEMLVYDYLNFVADSKGIEEEKRLAELKRVADVCQIKDVMHKPVNELSKGYKQRVGLAAAMLGDPDILVLDEPTSGLDPNQIVEIREIIKEIGKEKTVLFSTHILSEAEATCDRLVIISKGKIVADGKTEELKRGRDKFIVNLELENVDSNTAVNELKVVNGVEDVKVNSENGSLKLTLEGKEDFRREVYSLIKSKDWGLLEMARASETLEEIFKKLTRE